MLGPVKQITFFFFRILPPILQSLFFLSFSSALLRCIGYFTTTMFNYAFCRVIKFTWHFICWFIISCSYMLSFQVDVQNWCFRQHGDILDYFSWALLFCILRPGCLPKILQLPEFFLVSWFDRILDLWKIIIIFLNCDYKVSQYLSSFCQNYS